MSEQEEEKKIFLTSKMKKILLAVGLGLLVVIISAVSLTLALFTSNQDRSVNVNFHNEAVNIDAEINPEETWVSSDVTLLKLFKSSEEVPSVPVLNNAQVTILHSKYSEVQVRFKVGFEYYGITTVSDNTLKMILSYLNTTTNFASTISTTPFGTYAWVKSGNYYYLRSSSTSTTALYLNTTTQSFTIQLVGGEITYPGLEKLHLNTSSLSATNQEILSKLCLHLQVEIAPKGENFTYANPTYTYGGVALFESNGGTNASAIFFTGTSVVLPTITKTGHTFSGWTGSNGNTPSTNVSIAKGSTGDKSYTANWKVIQYDITYNLAGGSASPLQTSYNVESNSFTLPTPSRTGYTFTGWSGTGLSATSKNVTVGKGSTGNRSYTANWSVNYYTVNYYVQGSLWATRSVAYNTTPENLNAQSALDIYHKFNSWDGWVDKMPTNTVNLYANITESYCMLMTGHGPYGNAEGLLNVFKSAGWTGRIEEAPSAPGQYWVVTDYTLTRAQADIQRDYIANHTNYTNYNFPYLYWVAVSCTNGIGDTWTRGVGTKKFTSQY